MANWLILAFKDHPVIPSYVEHFATVQLYTILTSYDKYAL